eukprot:4126142-Alexandrium_andersonii.AAC.1
MPLHILVQRPDYPNVQIHRLSTRGICRHMKMPVNMTDDGHVDGNEGKRGDVRAHKGTWRHMVWEQG